MYYKTIVVWTTFILPRILDTIAKTLFFGPGNWSLFCLHIDFIQKGHDNHKIKHGTPIKTLSWKHCVTSGWVEFHAREVFQKGPLQYFILKSSANTILDRWRNDLLQSQNAESSFCKAKFVLVFRDWETLKVCWEKLEKATTSMIFISQHFFIFCVPVRTAKNWIYRALMILPNEVRTKLVFVDKKHSKVLHTKQVCYSGYKSLRFHHTLNFTSGFISLGINWWTLLF